MASWDRNFTGGTYASRWHARLDYYINGQNTGGNYSSIGLRMYVWGDSGYSQTGTWVPRVRGSWMGEVGGNTNTTIGSGMVLLVAWDGNVGHDANGNLYVTIGDYCNAPINDMSWSDIGWTLPRIARAPYGIVTSADTIKPTSARLGTEMSSFGHGTSAATRLYYRIQGSGSGWSQTADQGDVGGYNYWTVTGLKPGTNYEFFARWWNNNGDTADSSTSTFKTKSIPGMLPVLMGVM